MEEGEEGEHTKTTFVGLHPGRRPFRVPRTAAWAMMVM